MTAFLLCKVAVMKTAKAQPCRCPSLTGEFIQMAGLGMADLHCCPVMALRHNITSNFRRQNVQYQWMPLADFAHEKDEEITSVSRSVLVSSMCAFSSVFCITSNLVIVFQKAVTYTYLNHLAASSYNSSLFCCQEHSIISYISYCCYRIKTTT